MIGIEISQLLNQISMSIEDPSCGLSANQIDEMTQIIGLIKKILSDGLQRQDIAGLITLMGEMSEIMPEFADEIDEIIKDLKKLDKTLYEQDLTNSDAPKLPKSLLSILGVEAPEEALEVSANEDNISKMLKQSIDDDDVEDPRFAVAEKILYFLMDKVVLSDKLFDKVTNQLGALSVRKNAQSNPKESTSFEDSMRDTVEITPVSDVSGESSDGNF